MRGRLLLLAWCCLARPGAGAESQVLALAGRRVEVSADRIRYEAKGGLVVLSGQARLRVEGTTFSADLIRLDLSDRAAPRALAEGHLVLDDARGRVEGERLEYDLAGERGTVTMASLTVPVNPRGALSDLLAPHERPRQLRLTASEVSREGMCAILRGVACWLPGGEPPQFRVKAGSAVLSLAADGALGACVDRLSLRRTAVQIHGLNILRLPEMRLGEGGVFLPTMSLNRTHGFYVEQGFVVPLRPGLRYHALPRLGTIHGLTGVGRLRADSRLGRWELASSYRDVSARLSGRRDIEFSRLGELSLTPRAWSLPALGGTLSGSATAGLVHEHGGATAWRASAGLALAGAFYHGRTSRLGYDAMGRYSLYGGGSTYGWARGTVQVEKDFDHVFWGSLGLRVHGGIGHTPFLHDLVDVPRELVQSARWRCARHWVLSEDLSFDLHERRVRLAQAGLAYRDRLLEYGLVLRSLPTFSVNVQAKLLGF